MSHHTYVTPTLVLGGVPVGEGNRFLSLFTRELGFVRAVGKSLREERSRLRYHLNEYALVEVSLVRGREVWRVVGAQDGLNLYTKLEGNREKQLLLSRVAALLSRLLQGEDADPILFDMVERGLLFLVETPLDTELVRDFEYMFVIQILARLGYVGDQKELDPLLTPAPFTRTVVESMSLHRDRALEAINRALEASGL